MTFIDPAPYRRYLALPLDGVRQEGQQLHVLSDAQGLPLVVGVSTANVADIEVSKPPVTGLT
ncbi:hypothetical protein [Actinomadura verrucosospora]|uniref:Uncharacterized protein n=1 Tax=Actinomadura verrucosospora TaxID=46165 RepID=A0A7D3ZJT5_ACTVE|nr:hypothetical protein [Actinomadura verrucosospora]QKG20042.1 hypothetical protein ACTIVE_1678 [Actinomadura verrucosospora]